MRRAFFAFVTFVLAFGALLGANTSTSFAVNDNIGYAKVPFGNSIGDDPTAAKPQSKLWHNDGYWWAVMFSVGDNRYNIFRMNPSTPSDWVDTHVAVDDRLFARADALSDGSRLYILSVLSDENSASGPGRLYRYNYNTASDAYAPDGSPVVVTGSASTPNVETMTIDKDTTGRLWVTYTDGAIVKVNYGDNDGATWGQPFALPGSASVGSDDISSLVAYTDKDGSSIGVLWSSHTSSSAASYMYFAHHKDSNSSVTQAADWNIEQIYGGNGTCLADDHINIKSLQSDPSSGALFAAVKTSIGDSGCNANSPDGLRLVVRKPDSTWKITAFSAASENYTRPIVVLDSQNRDVYMFATAPTSCGVIFYKKTSMANPSFAGKAQPFISSSTYTCLNNATSTKQPVDNSTGLVVLASNETSGKRYYLHNYLALGTQSATATSTTGATATPTSTVVPGSTATPTATATTPAGGTRIRDITFENCTLGTAPTCIDATSGTVDLVTASPLKGTTSAQINNSTGQLKEDFTATDELFASFYIKLPAKPTTTARLVLITAGGTAGNLYITPNQTLQLRNGSTTIGSASPVLALNTVYRVGLHQKKGSGNGVLEAFVAPDNTPFGAAFASSSTQTISSQATRLTLGATNSAAVNVVVDDIQLDTAAFAGSGSQSPTATATNTPVATDTPTATATSTPTDIPTATPTTDPAVTPSATPTATNTPIATSTPTATSIPSGGTPIKAITFESGCLSGSTCADGADSVSGSVTRITSGALKGTASAQVAASSASAYLQEDFTAVDNLYASFYLKIDSLPTSDMRIVLISNSGTTAGELMLRSGGALRLRNAGTTVGSDSAVLSAGTIYRIGLVQQKGSGGNAVLQAFLATGDAAFGAPFAQTSTGTWTTQANRLRLGATVSATVNLVVDDVKLDASAMP